MLLDVLGHMIFYSYVTLFRCLVAFSGNAFFTEDVQAIPT